LSGSVGLDHWLHIVTAVLTDTSLLENPLGTVRTFAFLADFGGQAGAVASTELNLVGIVLLANGASFHERC